MSRGSGRPKRATYELTDQQALWLIVKLTDWLPNCTYTEDRQRCREIMDRLRARMEGTDYAPTENA